LIILTIDTIYDKGLLMFSEIAEAKARQFQFQPSQNISVGY